MAIGDMWPRVAPLWLIIKFNLLCEKEEVECMETV